MIRTLTLLLGALLFRFAPAQTYEFKHFDVADGIPSTQVYQIMQDGDGYLWFATDRGVCRYDGYRFETFTRKDGLTDEVVFGFHPAEDGSMWFYTFNGGLCYYRNGSIRVPAFNSALKDTLTSLGSPIIVSLNIDSHNNIWIGCDSEDLLMIGPEGNIRMPYADDSKYQAAKLVEIESNRKQNLVGTGARNSRRLSGISVISRKDSFSRTVSLAPHQPLPGTHSCFRAKFHRIDEHTLIYAYGSTLFKLVDDRLVQHVQLGDDHCTEYALLLDQSGDLWAGTLNGVLRFRNADLSTRPDVFLENQPISSVWQDHEGGYWFSSLKDGLFYLPHLHIRSVSKAQLGDSKIVQILSTPFGVYAASMEQSLFIFPQGRDDRITKIPMLCSYNIFGSLTSWGDYVMTRRDRRNYLKDTTLITNPPFRNFPFAFRNDHRSDYLWSISSGRFRLISTRRDSVVASFDFDEGRIYCATATPDLSGIWIGTSSNLYACKEGVTEALGDRFNEFHGRISDLDMIGNHLLVTTRGSGMLKYNFKDQTVVKLEGVPNEYCNSCYVDEQGVAWVASFSGLTRIDGITSDHPVYHHFSTHDGLISNEVYGVTSFGDQIWTATGKGVNWWQRDWLPKGREVQVRVNRFLVNNEEVEQSARGRFSSNRNNVQFSFSSISFRRPMEYEYRLKGLHANWIATTQPTAIYSALKPGDYIFELRPADDPQVHVALPFSIAVPFWKNPLFLACLALLTTLGIVLALRLRYQTILKENKLYSLFLRAEQKALRAQVNPHFLFNVFNSIQELLIKEDYPSARKYMTRFSLLMRKVLQHSRQEDVLLTDEIELLDLYLHLEKLRFGSALDFRINLHPDLNPDATLLPALFLQPYVENAIKHGIRSRTDGKGVLLISFTPENHRIRVRIEDNGKGYDGNTGLTTKNSYGMKINGERIELFNKEDLLDIRIAVLQPENKEYPGTVVELFLPYRTNPRYESRASENTDR